MMSRTSERRHINARSASNQRPSGAPERPNGAQAAPSAWRPSDASAASARNGVRALPETTVDTVAQTQSLGGV